MLLSKTPLRISFVGGGTDYFHNKMELKGRVIVTTINKFMYVTLNKKHNDDCRISYSETENVKDVNYIKHDIIREGLKLFKIKNGIELTTIADIPSSGSGLASSSALSVGLCRVLSGFKKINTNSRKDAENACKIEIVKCKKPIGMQDQYSTAYGGLNKIEFFNNKVSVKKINLSNKHLKDFNNNLVLFYTGINRKADKILSKIIKSGNHLKNYEKLSELAKNFENELLLKNFSNCGEILHENWMLKKNLHQSVSSLNLDDIYKTALNSGAIGGKLLGAGGGGYFLFIVDPKKKKKLIKNLSKLNHINFSFHQKGTELIKI